VKPSDWWRKYIVRTPVQFCSIFSFLAPNLKVQNKGELCFMWWLWIVSRLYFIFKQQWACLITSTATRRKFLARLWTWPTIYYWMNYELLIIIIYILVINNGIVLDLEYGSVKLQTHNYCLYRLHGLICSVLDYRSLPPKLESCGGYS